MDEVDSADFAAPSESELWHRVHHGPDPEAALGALYDHHAGLVYGLALKVLRNPAEAEDLTQEVFVSLCGESPYDPSRGSLGAYLTVFTRSRAIDRLRRGSRRRKQAVAPLMRERGWGRIINISGLAARISRSIVGSMRNVSVAAMTKNLADILGPNGINVTVVHPGATRTESAEAMIAARAEAMDGDRGAAQFQQLDPSLFECERGRLGRGLSGLPKVDRNHRNQWRRSRSGREGRQFHLLYFANATQLTVSLKRADATGAARPSRPPQRPARPR